MKTKLMKQIGILVILVAMMLILPIAGNAETKTYEEHVRFAANEGIYFWFQPDNFEFYGDPEIDQYVHEQFIRDWNGNGVIEADELNENVRVKWTGATLTDGADTEFGNWGENRVGDLRGAMKKASASDSGKTVTLTLTNKAGEQFIMNFLTEYNQLVLKEPVIETTGEINMEYATVPTVLLDEGESVTVTIAHQYEGNPNHNFAYDWFFEDRQGNRTALSATGNTCTYTMEEAGCIICETYVYESDMTMAYAFTQVNVMPPVVFITFDVETSHPVVNKVMTVTEGDTVFINTNAVASKPNMDIDFFWTIDTIDENGDLVDEDLQEGVGAAFTFTAKLDHDGKMVWCSARTSDNYESDWLYYTLKVLPKKDYVYKTEYVGGIPESALTEDLKKIPELNTGDKIEAAMEIKVLAQAAAAGMKIDSEETKSAVYEVTLMVSEDGGKTFVEATKENWPDKGITVTLPYPAGTGMHTHNFVVAHMFTETTAKHKAGDVEYPAVTNTPNGITFVVDGLSPIAIAWDEKPVVSTVAPATGDSATPYLWLLGMAMAAAGYVMLSKRRQHN